MNVSGLPELCIMKQSLCMICLLVYLKYFPHVRQFIVTESLLVVGFSPHVDTMGVFGIARDHTCPNVLVRKGGDRAAN